MTMNVKYIPDKHPNASSVVSLHSSIILNKGNILADGYNATGRKIFGCSVPSVHAEVSAIHSLYNSRWYNKRVNMRTNSNNKKAIDLTLVVVRYDRHGNLKNSKPCLSCTQLIYKFNINKVSYSSEDGTMITVRTRDLVDCQTSKGMIACNTQVDWKVCNM